MDGRFTDKFMKSVYFYRKESCSNQLFQYPCKEPNSRHLEKRTVAIFDTTGIVQKEWFSDYGANVLVNPSDEELKKAKIAVVMPNNGTSYYDVLDYYVQLLQKLIRFLKAKHNFKHIIVVLPPKSDECCTELPRMAHYSIYGLIKGLGKTYAANSLFVNGIILNSEDPLKFLQDRMIYLASDNSCNTVGQIFKL